MKLNAQDLKNSQPYTGAFTTSVPKSSGQARVITMSARSSRATPSAGYDILLRVASSSASGTSWERRPSSSGSDAPSLGSGLRPHRADGLETTGGN